MTYHATRPIQVPTNLVRDPNTRQHDVVARRIGRKQHGIGGHVLLQAGLFAKLRNLLPKLRRLHL